MVNDFSDYARNPSLELRTHNITNLIRDVLDLYQNNSQHTIKLSSKAKPCDIRIDSTRFRQVIHNLVKNAIEASEDAQLTVNIKINCTVIKHNHMNWLELSVNDRGPGIPEEMLNKVFEPYATNKSKGTGLGLAIVKKIIEEHRGIVWAENRQPNGACIIIRLPLEEADV
jgi:nitrogen fixation/metabolism regulation signal transduction histidine kinase